MSINLHLYATKTVYNKKTRYNKSKQKLLKEEFSLYQTPTDVSYNVIKSNNKLSAYSEYVKSNYSGKNHLDELNNWINKKIEDDYIIEWVIY